jgi:hypothetical protein
MIGEAAKAAARQAHARINLSGNVSAATFKARRDGNPVVRVPLAPHAARQNALVPGAIRDTSRIIGAWPRRIANLGIRYLMQSQNQPAVSYPEYSCKIEMILLFCKS